MKISAVFPRQLVEQAEAMAAEQRALCMAIQREAESLAALGKVSMPFTFRETVPVAVREGVCATLITGGYRVEKLTELSFDISWKN